MSAEDRTVHGVTPDGTEIVRYDRSGKWYAENGDKRVALNLGAAVAMARGGTVYLGLPGGRRFDYYARMM